MPRQAVSRLQRNANFLFRKWLFILIWPLVGILLISIVWLYTSEKIAAEKAQAENDARLRAASIANTYAQQITHMVEQIDRITLRLKYAAEEANTSIDLDKERKQGLFPATEMLYAGVFNAAGDITTSSIAGLRTLNVADLPYFQFHKTTCCAELLISPPSESRALGRTIVRFSRRLNAPDGSFDGIALVSVEPPYLLSYQEQAITNDSDFVSLRMTSGPLLSSQVGRNQPGTRFFYRQDPIFPEATGITLEPGEKFHDGQARFVAWKKVDHYPLVTITGLTVHHAMASFRQNANAYRNMATLQSVFLLVLMTVAVFLATKRAQRLHAENDTRETYRIATDAAHEGFYMIRPVYDRQGCIKDFRLDDCNNRAAELIGSTRDKIIGMHASQLRPLFFRTEIFNLARAALEKGFLEEEIRVSPRSPLQAKWIYRRAVRSEVGFALTIRDISEEKEQEEALAHLANHDTLTQLPNRNWLTRYLPNAVRQASHHVGHLAVLFIDLDNFKNVNDTLGHDAGDELLVQAAHRLKGSVRASDHVTRLGGDEFVVILDNVEIVDDVSRVAKTIVNAISKPFELAVGIGHGINASIGISLYPQDGEDADALLKHADVAMYAAKAAGKGRYAFYHAHLSDSLILRLSKEQALREAVHNDQFIVHYQPRVGVHSGQLTSMEALVRWNHPQNGLIYPNEFIEMAEDIGLIARIGEIVIENVCAQLAIWKKQDLQLVPVSVNVSSHQLKSGKLSGFISDCIARFAIVPSLIEVELTESAVIDNSLVVTKELAALRAIGVKLMIDDFGTGYSSISQLHRIDVDVLKVDREFTKALCAGSEGRLLFGAIMSMASALDMCVVAEGVETVEELNILHTLSCDEIQGHIVSKAVAASEMTQMILKRFLLSPTLGPNRLRPA